MRILVLASVLGLFATSGCTNREVLMPATFVKIPKGSFTMGSPATEMCREGQQGFKETEHKVTLAHAFEMSVTETTGGQFERRLQYDPTRIEERQRCGPNCPAERLTWHEAAAYCNALSVNRKLPPCYKCTGTKEQTSCDVLPAFAAGNYYKCTGFRLPTEAEWEYACRATTTTAYHNGDNTKCDFDPKLGQIAWYIANAGGALQMSGVKEPNKWGLKDMPGNVWEWVHDWFTNDLGSAPVTDPVGPSSAINRALRGGSLDVKAQFLRCASRRLNQTPTERVKLHGFRCARSLP